MNHQTTALLTVLLLAAACLPSPAEAVSRWHIANTARSHVGESSWMVWRYRRGYLPGTNKCNIFVAEVLEEAGASVPQRNSRFYSWAPIGAGEWGNPSSSYLQNNGCWENRNSAETGYVIGDGVHVGIVTGHQTTTSALQYEPVKSNDWGFRSGQSVTFWEYTC